MSPDIDYRYRRALQPDGISTYENAINALNEAIADVRLAGRTVSECPAVILLTRHLLRIAEGQTLTERHEDHDLRRQCIERLADLKHTPAIIALVQRGLDYKPDEIRHYRREGTRTLRQLARLLSIDPSKYRLNYVTPQESLAGDHILEAPGVYIRLSPERYGAPGLAWKNPFWKPPGATMRKAPITVLRDLPAFAARLSRELKIAAPAQQELI